MALPAVFAGLLRAASAAMLRTVGLGTARAAVASRPAISGAAKGLKAKAKEGFGKLAAKKVEVKGQLAGFKAQAWEVGKETAQHAGRVLEGHRGPENALALSRQLGEIARQRAGGSQPAAPRAPAPGQTPAAPQSWPRLPWWLGGPRQPAASPPAPRPAQRVGKEPPVGPGQASPMKGPTQEAAEKLRRGDQPTPPAAASAQGPAPTPLAQVRPAERFMGGHAPTAIPVAQRPPPPHVGPAGSTGQAAPPPHVGPSGQAREPRGMFEDAAARFQQWRQGRAQTASDYQESKRPVSDDTKGMNLQERYDRLAKNNILPKIETVAKALGTPNPSQQQQVEFGEKGEQERRDERRSVIERSGGPAISGKTTALAMLLGVELPAAAGVAVFGLEKFGSKIMDSNENLRRWSQTINTAFAQLEHQSLVLDAKTAQATKGSAGELGAGLKQLRNDLQPMREGFTTAKNLVGLGVVYLGILVEKFVSMAPHVQAGLMALKIIEAHLAAQERRDMTPFVDDFLKHIRDGNLGRQDLKPRAGPLPDRPGPRQP